jgi:hypothetical protein
MLQHIDHPYPTDEDKELLTRETGLSLGQISTWMANTRRRQKARPKRCASPSIRPSTGAIDIPAGRTWESLSKSSKDLKLFMPAINGRYITFHVKSAHHNGDVPVVQQPIGSG